MADLEEEENAAGHDTEHLGFWTRLLDPHLYSAERRGKIVKPRWSRRKAFTFILVVSLALWGMIIWGVFYLISLF